MLALCRAGETQSAGHKPIKMYFHKVKQSYICLCGIKRCIPGMVETGPLAGHYFIKSECTATSAKGISAAGGTIIMMYVYGYVHTHIYYVFKLKSSSNWGGFNVPAADYIMTEFHGCKSKQAIITSVHLIWTWLHLLQCVCRSSGHSRTSWNSHQTIRTLMSQKSLSDCGPAQHGWIKNQLHAAPTHASVRCCVYHAQLEHIWIKRNVRGRK